MAMVSVFVFVLPAREPEFQKINRLRVSIWPQAVYTAGLSLLSVD